MRLQKYHVIQQTISVHKKEISRLKEVSNGMTKSLKVEQKRFKQQKETFENDHTHLMEDLKKTKSDLAQACSYSESLSTQITQQENLKLSLELDLEDLRKRQLQNDFNLQNAQRTLNRTSRMSSATTLEATVQRLTQVSISSDI
jgi:chromosome segregation ATPase